MTSMHYPLATDSWDWREKLAILKVMWNGRYTMGPEVAEFERRFARKMNMDHAVMVNSGSSANLIGLSAMVLNEKYNLSPGDEVIVPAISWSTTYFPLTQLGLVPVFVDVDMFTFNIDINAVKRAITPKTRAIFAVNLLGLPCDLPELKSICTNQGIYLIEDNCESYGAKYHTTWFTKYAGTFGTFGTFSFFFSHHLQTMEGGMIVTDDASLADYMRSLRAHGWVRDLKTNELYTKTGDPFEDSFKFVLPGYCVRPLEMSGAIGQVQLHKMDEFIRRRRINAEVFQNEFDRDFIIQCEMDEQKSSWFGFGVVLKNSLEGRRAEVIAALRKNNIETRPIVAGNFANQPVVKNGYMTSRISGNLSNADYIDQNGFFFGNDHRDLSKHIRHARKVIGELM